MNQALCHCVVHSMRRFLSYKQLSHTLLVFICILETTQAIICNQWQLQLKFTSWLQCLCDWVYISVTQYLNQSRYLSSYLMERCIFSRLSRETSQIREDDAMATSALQGFKCLPNPIFWFTFFVLAYIWFLCLHGVDLKNLVSKTEVFIIFEGGEEGLEVLCCSHHCYNIHKWTKQRPVACYNAWVAVAR